MPKPGRASLSGLENKVMRVVWRQGQATAEVVRAALVDSDDLKDSTVRTILRRLEQKGYVTHQTAGRTYVYSPTVAQRNVAADAVRGIIQRLCDGSVEDRYWAWSTAKWFRRTCCSDWPSGLPKTRKPAPATRNVQAARKVQERDSAMANYFTTTTQLLVDTSAGAVAGGSGRARAAFLAVRNANFQHRAWTAVLWGMLLLPVLAQLTPGLSLLPSGWRWEPRAVIAQSSIASEKTIPAEPNTSRPPAHASPRDTTGEPARATAPDDWAASPAARPADLAGGASDRAGTADASAASSGPTGSVAADSGAPRAATMPETSALGWTGVIMALYLFGVALLLARLALGYWAVRRLVRRATDIPRPLDCRARLAASDAVRVPVSVGLLQPVILLPADWGRWSQALLSSVVAHEQAHIDRRDHLVLLASELNRCLYWFHPVAWFLRRRLSALAEQCCDDTVIAALQSRGDYARHLLEIASRLTSHPRRVAPLGISMARGSQVESRIVAILDERRPLAGRIGRGEALALAAIVGPIVLLAAGLRRIRRRKNSQPPQPKSPSPRRPNPRRSPRLRNRAIRTRRSGETYCSGCCPAGSAWQWSQQRYYLFR